MYRVKWIYAIVTTILLSVCSAALAHEGMEHVMGTVVAVADNSVTVETVKHAKVTVLIDPSTKFIDNDAHASFKDLKIGDRVVIHAKPTPQKQLLGVEVKWGASPSGQK